LGVLGLVKKHGAAAVEAACAAALECQVPDHRFVRRYLERQLPAPLTLRQVDPLIRELCGGRRMSELAAQLVDRLIPRVPVRQWVLSVPFGLRYQLASTPR
jgi:hypothetical protein